MAMSDPGSIEIWSYSVAQADAGDISGYAVHAIDGDIGMTQCSVHVEDCERTTYCPTRPHWAAINRAVGAALAAVTLNDMISPFAFLAAAAPQRDSAPQTART